MGFTLYSLIEAALLCVNAVAILNEQRFLARCKYILIKFTFISCFIGSGGVNRQTYPSAGGYIDEYQNTGGTKQQLLNLIRSVRTVMRSMF